MYMRSEIAPEDEKSNAPVVFVVVFSTRKLLTLIRTVLSFIESKVNNLIHQTGLYF
jgi:hypothetical protein